MAHNAYATYIHNGAPVTQYRYLARTYSCCTHAMPSTKLQVCNAGCNKLDRANRHGGIVEVITPHDAHVLSFCHVLDAATAAAPGKLPLC